jgi:hypothetical protein
MCITLAIASTAVSAFGAMQQATAQRAQAEYNAAVARNNSIISAQNEADIIQRGEVARNLQSIRIDQTMGAARAAIAGSGMLLEGGGETTTGALLGDLQTAGQFDIMTLKTNIDREARRARIEGGQFQAQADLFDLQASSISPLLAGAAAGFANANSLYNMFAPSTPTFGGATRGSILSPAKPARPRAKSADFLG